MLRPSVLPVVLLTACGFGLAAGAVAAEITGKARAVAGDRLEIAGTVVQLFGLDAPEPDQACLRDGRRWECGFAATAALAFRTAGQWLSCVPLEADAAGTPLAVCSMGGDGGPAVNGWMVEAGWGVADRPPLFAEQEAAARAARRGIWGGAFVPPADWRRGERLAIETAPGSASQLCSIKGSVGADGERTYHLPGGAFYPQATVDPALGGRWFCSEAEAQAAGWRRSER
jgi:endonuclease YncB( thermonuclease family)